MSLWESQYFHRLFSFALERRRMRKEELLNEYFDYLCEIFKLRLPRYKKYRKVIARLFETEYTWDLEMDENRAKDGLDLRTEFLYSRRLVMFDVWDDPCNCLEMLLAFSRRIEIEVMGTPGEDNLSRWFWEMLHNLGLLKAGIYEDKTEIDRILDIWLSRRFTKKGRGNIFLTHKNDTDLRTVEFWWQMQRYMSEIYGD